MVCVATVIIVRMPALVVVLVWRTARLIIVLLSVRVELNGVARLIIIYAPATVALILIVVLPRAVNLWAVRSVSKVLVSSIQSLY